MTVMEELFGVKRAKTDRIRRTGHWVPRVTGGPYWDERPAQAAGRVEGGHRRRSGNRLGAAARPDAGQSPSGHGHRPAKSC